MSIRPIRLLDAQTADRIAAGEVVERPASVVKELVENALDAGATAVTVDIAEGGAKRIRVTDNGHGIEAQDVRLAFERHATSKIKSGDDLVHIGTLGFRGEALPSIASVAKVRLTTRTAGQEAGVAIEVAGGEVLSVKPAGCPQGTTVIVEDLFFNTPARRKFLRKPQTETGHIADSLMALALSRPNLSLRFSQDGRTVFQTAGDGKLKSAAYTLFGPRIAAEMIPIEGQSGYVKVSGLVGVGAATRSGRDYEFVFVGGRVVRCAPIYQGLESALRERIMIGKYPICAINVQVPDACVDVNCHPAKIEVRFTDEAYVRQAVYDVVRDCVGNLTSRAVMEAFAPQTEKTAAASEKMPEKQPEVPKIPDKPAFVPAEMSETKTESAQHAKPAVPQEQGTKPAILNDRDQAEAAVKRAQEAKFTFAVKPQISSYQLDPARPLGAFAAQGPLTAADGGNAFAAPETPKASMPERPKAAATEMPDAAVSEMPKPSAPEKAEKQPEPEKEAQQLEWAHEQSAKKLPPYTLMGQVFDTYLFLKTEKSVVIIDQHAAHERILYDKFMALYGTDELAQRLLIPMIFDVTLRDKQRILDQREELLQAGFEIEEFGPAQVRVVSVPVIMGQPQVKSFFDELVSGLDELGSLRSAEIRRTRIIRLACRKAIKGGDPLKKQEIDALLTLLSQSDSPPTCPHGRPIFVSIDENELKKRFKRIV